MAEEAYLTTDDYRASSMGGQLSGVEDTELSIILLTASTLCDQFCNRKFRYHTVKREVHEIYSDSDSQMIYLRDEPVRTIQSLTFVTSTGTGGYGVDVDAPPITDPEDLPSSFGNVYLDRDVGAAIPVGPLLSGFIPLLSFSQLKAQIAYTAGYDSGTPADPDASPTVDAVVAPYAHDGYILPYPDWLKEATRLAAQEMLAIRFMNMKGLTGDIQMISTADTRVSRQKTPPRGESALPSTAQLLLTPHKAVYVA